MTVPPVRPGSPTAPQNTGRVVRTATALTYAALCHGLFGLAIASMTGNMFFGMTYGLGRLEGWMAVVANGLLIAQFAGGHSFLLTRGGNGVLKRLAPRAFASDLAPTTYVIVASLQLLALFVLWSPSGIVWWRAEGTLFWVIAGLALCCWAMLGKSILDAGFGLQSGMIGWWAVLRGRRPVYPDMPERGLFAIVRQPIYVAFALGCWAVAVWTPDQLAIALMFTAYCLVAPLHKEARFRKHYGARFEAYVRRVPYWLPFRLRRASK